MSDDMWGIALQRMEAATLNQRVNILRILANAQVLFDAIGGTP